MGCQQSVPATTTTSAETTGPKIIVTETPLGEDRKYKGVGQTERLASRALRRAEEEKKRRKQQLENDGKFLGAGGGGIVATTIKNFNRQLSGMSNASSGGLGSMHSTGSSTTTGNAAPVEPPKLDPDGRLMPEEVVRRTASSITNSTTILGKPTTTGNTEIVVEYAYQTQRGYYPDDPHKENQDAFNVTLKFGSEPRDAMLGVYDGHGVHGHSCARYARKKLPALIEKYVRQTRSKLYRKQQQSENGSSNAKMKYDPRNWPFLNGAQYQECCTKAFKECNQLMHDSDSVKDKMSGTTACTALFHGNLMTIANVGDSRIILGHNIVDNGGQSSNSNPSGQTSEEEKTEISSEEEEEVGKQQHQQSGQSSATTTNNTTSNTIVAVPLSRDQTPYRQDERERVKSQGASILSVDQLEGHVEVHDNWGDDLLAAGKQVDIRGDPPRVWVKNKDYPGCAFTRSIGDYLAESIGVTAEPEMISRTLTPNDKYLVIASDGVYEFLTNQQVIDICRHCETPLVACDQLVRAAYNEWLTHEDRTDDITVIVCFLNVINNGQNEQEDEIAKQAGTTEDLVALVANTMMNSSSSSSNNVQPPTTPETSPNKKSKLTLSQYAMGEAAVAAAVSGTPDTAATAANGDDAKQRCRGNSIHKYVVPDEEDDNNNVADV